MSGWSAPFAKRVLESWKAHSRDVGAKAVADQVRENIKAKAVAKAGHSSETAGSALKATARSEAPTKR